MSAALRAQQAIQFFQQGLNYDQIAERAGYASRGAAHNAIQRELSRVLIPEIEQARKVEEMRLDALLASIWPLAFERLEPVLDADGKPKVDKDGNERLEKKSPNLFAVDRILAIAERRARLLGLDTPVQAAPAPTAQVLVQQVNFSPESI